MKPRVLVLMAGAAAALALLVSLSIASAGTTRPAKVTSAAAIGRRPSRTRRRSRRSTAARRSRSSATRSADRAHARHQRSRSGSRRTPGSRSRSCRTRPRRTRPTRSSRGRSRRKSSSIDVAMIDVVWPGAFAPYLVDLKPKLGKQAKLHAAGIVANDTVDGKLVAMPWFGDFGILYYRTDLLKKYGYTAPPTTWTELFADGEEDPGRRAEVEPELLRLRLPGQLATRASPATRSSGSRRRAAAIHRRRQGRRSTTRRPPRSSTCSARTSARPRRAA